MNSFTFHIVSGKRDLGEWSVPFAFDETDARERMRLSFSGTNIDHYGYSAELVKVEPRIFDDAVSNQRKESAS